MSDTTTHTHSATRTIDGHIVPAPGTWDIDTGHTDVAFIGRHFMVTKVRGRFTEVFGKVVISPGSAGRPEHGYSWTNGNPG